MWEPWWPPLDQSVRVDRAEPGAHRVPRLSAPDSSSELVRRRPVAPHHQSVEKSEQRDRGPDELPRVLFQEAARIAPPPHAEPDLAEIADGSRRHDHAEKLAQRRAENTGGNHEQLHP